jgi:hypothetical protein
MEMENIVYSDSFLFYFFQSFCAHFALKFARSANMTGTFLKYLNVGNKKAELCANFNM